MKQYTHLNASIAGSKRVCCKERRRRLLIFTAVRFLQSKYDFNALSVVKKKYVQKILMTKDYFLCDWPLLDLVVGEIRAGHFCVRNFRIQFEFELFSDGRVGGGAKTFSLENQLIHLLD